MTEAFLQTFKKDIDKVTDYYDRVRMYQYPVNGLMAITELGKKKWRRCMLKSPVK